MSLAFEAMFVKWLFVRGVDGAAGCQLALSFDGIYGLAMLAAVTVMGDGLFEVDLVTAAEVVVGGFLTSMALVLVNYTMANWLAGVAFSSLGALLNWPRKTSTLKLLQVQTNLSMPATTIANTFLVWHVLISWPVLN
mmetsp:Transcript_6379/g.8532  ORF Transcript_6379/g.8532 Transcript_6379/m.8532 type:complete len:137 (+) Transcript_6379:265-675(+)